MNERISVNPNIHFGKPCVKGTRITVQNVLELINEGITFKEIREDYFPDLEIEDINACNEHGKDDLKSAFVVVEAGKRRFRKI